MDNEGKFWIGLWSIAAITLVGIIGIGSLYHTNKNKLVYALLEEGYSARQISCAFNDISNREPNCMLLPNKYKLVLDKE